MAELVDALVSGTSIERCGGSSPLLGTTETNFIINPFPSFLKGRRFILLAISIQTIHSIVVGLGCN